MLIILLTLLSKPVIPIKSKNNFFIDNKFTLDPKKKYKTIGIVHATTAQPINLMRDWGNDIANAFGQKGFDDTLFAKARTDAVSELLT